MLFQYLKIVMRNIRRDWTYFLIITVCLAAGLTLFAILTVEDECFHESGYPGHERTFYAGLTDPDSVKERKKAAAWDYSSFIQNYQKEMELYGEKVYDAGCFYVEGVEDIVLKQASDDLRNQKGLSFHFAGKDFPYYYGGGTLKQISVSQSYYKYNNLTLLKGDRTPVNEYEIIVKESLLKRIGLSVDDIESYSVKPILSDDVTSDIEYRIVNVIKDDKWSKEDDYDCFHWASISRQYEDSFNPQVILAPGADKEAVNERLKTRQFTNTRGEIKIPQLSSEFYYHHDGLRNSLLYSLALIIAVVGFLKRLVQSMNQNRRAKQIHVCLGAGAWHILALQMLEVLIMLTASTLLSMYVSSFLTEFLNGNLDNLSFEHYLPFGDIVKIEMLTSVGVLTISAVVVLIATNFFIKNAYSIICTWFGKDKTKKMGFVRKLQQYVTVIWYEVDKDEDSVEITCDVTKDDCIPHPVKDADPRALELIRRVKAYENYSSSAIRNRSVKDAVDALTLHPLVNSYSLAKKLVNAYVELNREFCDGWK